MKQPIEKLKGKLSELFQLDQADLDFGIYRIMNAKRVEIIRFLEKDLLPQVKQAFKEYKPSDKAEIQKELEKVIEGIEASDMDPEQSPKVKELRARLNEEAVDLTALENEVYSRLCDFFSRYYDDGDFISLRRYKKDVYAIPYEGEEVKFHWANADQYYIKTTEYFRDYAFKVDGNKRVHFKIIEADTEKDNIKATNGNARRFLLSQDQPVIEEEGELVIRFEYRSDPQKRKQEALNAETIRRLLDNLKSEELAAWKPPLTAKTPTNKNSDRIILEKYLSDYTRRNTFDYFIHKDLCGFLRRELDFYIKNEIMHLDDVENESVPRVEQYLSKIRVIRKIAHKIIAFLAQIEDFQKKLWLKKKFVVETNYCVTIDRVPEKLYPEIVTNDAQRKEWVQLFAIDEIKRDLIGAVDYSEPLTIDFLKANPFLLLDTKFFSQDFKDMLLASFEDIENNCNGLLISSENFQALQLIREQYAGQVKCIYIDPPYNTNATPILYKNDYQRSSWLSLMRDRLMLGYMLMNQDDSYLSIAIDDHELANLSNLLEYLFPFLEIHRTVVVHYPGSGTGRSNVTRTHEYNLFLIPRGKDLLKGPKKENGWRERGFRRSGTGENNYRTGRPNSFFAVLVDPNTLKIQGFEPPPAKDDSDYPRGMTEEGFVRVYPIGEDGSERCWSLSYVGAPNALQKGLLGCTKNMIITRRFLDDNKRSLLQSVWSGKEVNAVTYGTNLLTDILGNSGLFSYPKSLYTVVTAIDAGTFEDDDSVVLDYFAGSGTTGHAVIDLNSQDDGNRKYILVEMGDYFDTVLVPRIKKVIYSKNWKNGKPVSREGTSHMFKYIRLESYEDALANLELKRTDAQKTLLNLSDSFRESYMLKYMLDTESSSSQSLLNIDAFEDPFNYKLLVGTGSVGETKAVNVDLVETFNCLLGLRVRHMDHIRGFRVIEGMSPEDEKVLIIWRNIKEKPNEDLDDFFRKQQYNTMDMEFDVIYVNGDNNLMNLPMAGTDGEIEPRYKVRLIEEEFSRLMFDVKDV